MVIGLGIDVVELDRIEETYRRFGERFLKRMLSEYELTHKRRQLIPFLAARFAAKEAGAKALGTGFRRGVSLRTIEVRELPSGKPEVFFLGPALEVFRELGGTSSHISLTHGRDTAAAVVVIEK
jgi:holo-[acyl-carrier protein] synthase